MGPTRTPYLGELELTVMEALWAQGETDAKALQRTIGRARGITVNTLQSTLKRLHDKGLLRRDKVSHAYVYAPRVTRKDYHSTVLDDVIAKVMDGRADAMLAAFVDVTARAGEGQLARLEQMIADRRRALEAGDDDPR